jgi:PAS domain S-box-containing protein
MNSGITQKLMKINLWHFLWISILLSEILTAIMSIILRGKITQDYLITGGIVSLIVASSVIYLLRQIINLFKKNLQLQEEIDEQQKRERSLKKVLVDQNLIMEAVPDIIYVLDPTGKIIKWNSQAEIATGYSIDELYRSHALDFIAEEDRATAAEGLEEAYLKRKASRELKLLTKKGKKIPYVFSGASIRNAEGTFVGFVGIGRDISESKKLEEELLKIQKLESLGILAGGIAHDFNNLLTSIAGYIDVSRMNAENHETTISSLQEAKKVALRARHLTNQLLTFSKGGSPVKKTATIEELIRESVSFALSGSSTKCDYFFSNNLWPVEVDQGQIGQVINNLIINADQSMPGGGIIRIRCENARITPDIEYPLKAGKFVKVTIQDYGNGIAPENIKNIFDPFFTTKERGRGLGLASAYSIISKHEGYIDVDSEVNSGSTFRIFIPASDGVISNDKQEKDFRVIEGARLLILDDEIAIRDAIGKMLESIGYVVDTAEDGRPAITLYRKAMESGRPYDAVILDLTVPGGMGGTDTLKELRKIDPEVKAIVSSGYSSNPVMSDYRRNGFKGVIKKPYSIEDLSDVICNVIDGE